MTEFLHQPTYLYKFVLNSELYTFCASGWLDIKTQFQKNFPEFTLKMHDECNPSSECCPDRAQVHFKEEIADLFELNFSKQSHREFWLYVS